MYLQTAADLFKNVDKMTKTTPLEGVYSYINETMVYRRDKAYRFDPTKMLHIQSVLKSHTLYYISKVIGKIAIKMNDIADAYQPDLIKLAQAHAIYLSKLILTLSLT